MKLLKSAAQSVSRSFSAGDGGGQYCRSYFGKRSVRTNDIVAIVVPNQTHNHVLASLHPAMLAQISQLVDDSPSPRIIRLLQTLLHDITRELVLAEALQPLQHSVEHAQLPVTGILRHDMLDDVIAILVRDHGRDALQLQQLFQDLVLRRHLAVLETPLDDSAAERMDAQRRHLATEGLEDERDSMRRTALDSFLYDVVAVLVLDAPHHMFFQLPNEKSLLVDEHVIQRFLHDAAAVHLQAQVQHSPSHVVGQDLLVSLVAVLEELLDHVVAEDIRHELNGIRLDLAEHALLLVRVGRLELRLDKTRSVLVACELCNVVVDILELIALGLGIALELVH